MLYAIMRHQKLKTWGHVAAVAGHHTRTRPTPNANPSTSNKWLVGDPARDICQSVRSLIGARKVRSNAVLAIEVVMTATPEFFRPGSPGSAGLYDPDRLAAFERQAMDWLRQTFGAGNVASAVVHLDESTPHVQAVVVPIDPDTDRLSASRWLDGPKKLRALQDSFADFCWSLGLSRGIKGSKAQHARVAQFYNAVNSAVPPAVPAPVVQIPPPMIMEATRSDWSAAESARISAEQMATLQPVTDLAAVADQAGRKQRQAEATAHAAQSELEQMRREAELVRDIPMVDVLAASGYQRHGGAWVGPAGRISIAVRNGKAKFRNDDLGIGGTGAIDLVKHLHGLGFQEAVTWLGRTVGRNEAIGCAMVYAREVAQKAVKSTQPLTLKVWNSRNDDLPGIEQARGLANAENDDDPDSGPRTK